MLTSMSSYSDLPFTVNNVWCNGPTHRKGNSQLCDWKWNVHSVTLICDPRGYGHWANSRSIRGLPRVAVTQTPREPNPRGEFAQWSSRTLSKSTVTSPKETWLPRGYWELASITSTRRLVTSWIPDLGGKLGRWKGNIWGQHITLSKSWPNGEDKCTGSWGILKAP